MAVDNTTVGVVVAALGVFARVVESRVKRRKNGSGNGAAAKLLARDEAREKAETHTLLDRLLSVSEKHLGEFQEFRRERAAADAVHADILHRVLDARSHTGVEGTKVLRAVEALTTEVRHAQAYPLSHAPTVDPVSSGSGSSGGG